MRDKKRYVTDALSERRNLTMLIRHYWRWINPGELDAETLARLGKRPTPL
jgi:hypothetical protein